MKLGVHSLQPMSTSQYNILIYKLDEFIRKYYKNQLIRGLIYTLALLLFSFVLITTIEYFGRFSSSIRTILFYSFVGGMLVIFTKWIVIPLFKLNKLGKIISHEDAAAIIGRHFSSIEDRLFNVLQLNNLLNKTDENTSLIEASINQKIIALKPIPFSNAVDFRSNKQFLKYLVIPALLFICIGIWQPAVFKDGTQRLVAHNSEFTEEAPFAFEVLNESLNGYKNEDFLVHVKLSGDVIPERVYVELDGNTFLINKTDKVTFNYILKNLQSTTSIRFLADGFYSKRFEINAIPKPMLLNFQLQLDYPDYTKLKDEVLQDVGDITLPEGTKATWKFNTTATENLFFSLNDSNIQVQQNNLDEYVANIIAKSSGIYSLTVSNPMITEKDTLTYQLQVVKDAFPGINVEQQRDSTSLKRIYFKGNIKDDYGFSGLSFVYSSGKTSGLKRIGIPFNSAGIQSQFFHVWDFESLDLNAGDELTYYFEVADNDGVNGSKVTKSSQMSFKVPTKEELEKKSDLASKEIIADLEKSIKDAEKMQKDIEKLNKNLVDKEKLGWQEKKQLQELLETQKKLQEQIEKSKNEQKKNNQEQKEFNELDQDILEKQAKLEELFEQLMTPEMKELYEELEKLMVEMNKDKLKDQLDKIELSNEELEKELDRSLEIFKQLEFEQKLNETIDKLDELQKKQEELSEKSKDKKIDSEQIKKKQEELNKEFDELKEKLEELEQKNEELENPNEIPDTEEEEESVKEEMEKSSEELEKNDKQSASESQKKASDKMKEMAEKMKGLQMQMQSAGSEEDMEDIRALLENLIQLSFDQEALIKAVKGANRTDPKFVDYSQSQKKLIDDSKTIEDSLFALSKRVLQLEATVNREVSEIKRNMNESLKLLGDRNASVAASKQQFAMTSINNLALILDEALQQMQQQMQKGGGSCSKPGGKGKTPSAAQMKKMQEQLNKQMQQMKDGMQKGQMPGNKPGDKPGSKGAGGQGGMSKELAEMAAKQAAIRQELKKMQESLEEGGDKGGGSSLKKLSDLMEQTETDIVNRTITQETLNRQQDILTRLLESEKAEREREKDNKRESKTGRDIGYRNPEEFFEYNRQKEKEIELLQTMPPSFVPFYKNKTTNYFENIKQ